MSEAAHPECYSEWPSNIRVAQWLGDVSNSAMRALSGRLYKRKFTWGHNGHTVLLPVDLTALLILLFPLCLRVFGHTAECLKRQMLEPREK